MARQLEFTFADAPESKTDRRKRLLAGLLGEAFESGAVYWCEEAAAEAEERVRQNEERLQKQSNGGSKS